MNMRSLTFFGAVVTALTVAAVSNLAACGNGTGGAVGTGGGAGTGGSTANGTGGSPACSTSCAAAITTGDLVCGMTSAEMDYIALKDCGDMKCSSECMTQFDDGKGLDAMCGSCLTTNCKTEQDTCNNN